MIVYGGSGVCRVEQIAPGPQGRAYYTLLPLYQDCRIMTPVENQKVFTRRAITRPEAEALIAAIPGIRPQVFRSRIQRELTEHYESLLKTYDCRVLLELTMSIYQKKQEAQSQKRRLGAVDENYLRRAEELLFRELAAALGLRPQEVQPYIAARLDA